MQKSPGLISQQACNVSPLVFDRAKKHEEVIAYIMQGNLAGAVVRKLAPKIDLVYSLYLAKYNGGFFIDTPLRLVTTSSNLIDKPRD